MWQLVASARTHSVRILLNGGATLAVGGTYAKEPIDVASRLRNVPVTADRLGLRLVPCAGIQRRRSKERRPERRWPRCELPVGDVHGDAGDAIDSIAHRSQRLDGHPAAGEPDAVSGDAQRAR